MTYVASLAQLRLPLYFVITAVTYVSTQLYGDTESGHCLVGAGVTKLPFLFHPLERERGKISNIRLCQCSKNSNVSHPLLLIKCRKFLLA